LGSILFFFVSWALNLREALSFFLEPTSAPGAVTSRSTLAYLFYLASAARPLSTSVTDTVFLPPPERGQQSVSESFHGDLPCAHPCLIFSQRCVPLSASGAGTLAIYPFPPQQTHEVLGRGDFCYFGCCLFTGLLMVYLNRFSLKTFPLVLEKLTPQRGSGLHLLFSPRGKASPFGGLSPMSPRDTSSGPWKWHRPLSRPVLWKIELFFPSHCVDTLWELGPPKIWDRLCHYASSPRCPS